MNFTALRRFVFTVALAIVTAIPSSVSAQPGDPGGGGDPDVPIDGGIGLLIAAGALFGSKKIYDSRKRKK